MPLSGHCMGGPHPGHHSHTCSYRSLLGGSHCSKPPQSTEIPRSRSPQGKLRAARLMVSWGNQSYGVRGGCHTLYYRSPYRSWDAPVNLECSLPQHMPLPAHPSGAPAPRPPQSHMLLVCTTWRFTPGVYQAGLPQVTSARSPALWKTREAPPRASHMLHALEYSRAADLGKFRVGSTSGHPQGWAAWDALAKGKTLGSVMPAHTGTGAAL